MVVVLCDNRLQNRHKNESGVQNESVLLIVKIQKGLVKKRIVLGERNVAKRKDPKVGTGKKPKGSGRRLYTDEDPTDTVKVKFSTIDLVFLQLLRIYSFLPQEHHHPLDIQPYNLCS